VSKLLLCSWLLDKYMGVVVFFIFYIALSVFTVIETVAAFVALPYHFAYLYHSTTIMVSKAHGSGRLRSQYNSLLFKST
jgi:hypothetical protein